MNDIEVRIDDMPASEEDAGKLIEFVKRNCKSVKPRIRHYTLNYAEQRAEEKRKAGAPCSL